MEELYRLKRGKLHYNTESIDYFFGFVYDNMGELKIELYLEEENNFSLDYYFSASFESIVHNFNLEGITENNDAISCFNLDPIFLANSPKNNIILICRDHIVINKRGIISMVNGITQEDKFVFFIELEGLQLKHTEITQEVISNMPLSQNFKKGYTKFNSDHTLFQFGFPIGNQIAIRRGLIYNHPNGSNTIIEFENHLELSLLKDNKDQIISFLSFINGGEVNIRKVYRGNTYLSSQNKIDSQKIEHYSFKKIVHNELNDFIPINKLQFLKDNPFQRIMQYFPAFSKMDLKLNFKSVIYFLNHASKTQSIEQRIFTLIISLEELASKYEAINNSINKTIIPEIDFEPIKSDLKKALKKYKLALQKKHQGCYENLMSKLCDINSIKKSHTETRIKELLNYAKIKIDPSIDELIQKRHLVIHEAKIGDSPSDSLNYYYQLDNLLRNIILNIINYDGVRNNMHP